MVLKINRWRPSVLLVVGILLFAIALPLLNNKKASAYNLPTERMIQTSSSANGATAVTYKVKFKVGTAGTFKSLVVDFCSTTPIIGDTCTAPSGFTVSGSPSVTVVSTATLTGSWTAASLNTGRTLTLTNASGTAALSVGDVIEFDITGVTNPSTTNASYYARILTYANDSGANSAATYSATAIGTAIDAGGVALSTAEQIIVTAKVQERLLFCVYTSGTGNDCTSKTGSAIVLGDTNGVLSPSGPFVSTDNTGSGTGAQFSITTNASGGAIVRLKGSTLASGANTITALTSPTASSTGSEQFGLCLYESASIDTNLSIDTVYDGNALCSSSTNTAGTGSTGGDGGAEYALDTNGTDGTTSTYGDVLATKPAGNYSTATLAFLGNISNSTEAGIYTTTFTFIATGTY